MKKSILATLAAAAAVTAALPLAAETADIRALESVLSAYETALNAQDTDAIVALYADDGVFMPQHSQPRVGRDNLRAAYAGVFTAITLDIEFEVDEIEQLSDDWAFARTRSAGTVTVNATGDTGPEANQELFLFRRSGSGSWKIARYIFSTTNPPQRQDRHDGSGKHENDA